MSADSNKELGWCMDPKEWQPSGAQPMVNETQGPAKQAVPCLTLSRNDSYVLSSSGARVALFNLH
eukprot:CAMPEP_0183806954 /NCGR_PEP_ID=MMETSP0803_2-20130417/40365_1 /TAXON_ID=195967 /ORGANISM="Crustomastix stigmata, Strain CCMP3273" /LENGTH=64 /DNA_ID=CAMNT_0026051725 /DNA_START=1 /DNA_END=192 /DNA_ORIENTATION=+